MQNILLDEQTAELVHIDLGMFKAKDHFFKFECLYCKAVANLFVFSVFIQVLLLSKAKSFLRQRLYRLD